MIFFSVRDTMHCPCPLYYSLAIHLSLCLSPPSFWCSSCRSSRGLAVEPLFGMLSAAAEDSVDSSHTWISDSFSVLAFSIPSIALWHIERKTEPFCELVHRCISKSVVEWLNWAYVFGLLRWERKTGSMQAWLVWIGVWLRFSAGGSFCSSVFFLWGFPERRR